MAKARLSENETISTLLAVCRKVEEMKRALIVRSVNHKKIEVKRLR